MANLEDLKYKSISEMTTDEALEHLRLIRLSRRVPLQKSKSKSTRKVTKKAVKVPVNAMNAEQIEELLKSLGG